MVPVSGRAGAKPPPGDTSGPLGAALAIGTTAALLPLLALLPADVGACCGG